MTSSITGIISCLLLASQGLASINNNQQTEQKINNMMVAKMVEVMQNVETKLGADMEEMREEMEEKMLEKVDEITCQNYLDGTEN